MAGPQVSQPKHTAHQLVALLNAIAKAASLGQPLLGVAQLSDETVTLHFAAPTIDPEPKTITHPAAAGIRLDDALSIFAETDAESITSTVLQAFRDLAPVSVPAKLRIGDTVRLDCAKDPLDGNRLLLSITQVDGPAYRTDGLKVPPVHAQLTLERMITALETLEVGIAVYDEHDRLLFGNNRYFQYLPSGSLQDHIGRTFDEICTICTAAEVYGPLSKAGPVIAERLAAHRLGNQAFELTLPDKRIERIIERKTSWGGCIGIHFDVSDLYHAREDAIRALLDSEIAQKRLGAAIEAMPDGFVLWDENERLALCNSKYQQIYDKIADIINIGVPFSQFFRASVLANYHADVTADVDSWISDFLEIWRTEDIERTIKTPDGRYIRIMNSHHDGLGTLGIHTDVTDIMVARLEAIQSEKAKSMFLANMSHEIRTPLAGIISLAQLILDISTEDDVRARCATIVKFGSSLMTVLNDILDMSKLEVGKFTLLSEPICLKTFADRFYVLYAASAQEKGLRFDVNIDPQISGRLGDENRILQILNNVISNAIKFTQTGYVRVSMQDGESGDLLITITDTGIGMTAEQISRIFNPFEQADRTTSARFGGTGLGMSIVANLVKAMDGTIDVVSKVGKGTKITIGLPLLKSDSETRASGISDESHSLKGARILVAEDNDIIREMISIFLTRMECDVTVVGSGNSAYERYRSDAPFDLIFLDINMPDGDGATTLMRMRAHSEKSSGILPPIVAITANMLKHQVEEYTRMGFSDCLPKPFFKADLHRCISAHMKK